MYSDLNLSLWSFQKEIFLWGINDINICHGRPPIYQILCNLLWLTFRIIKTTNNAFDNFLWDREHGTSKAATICSLVGWPILTFSKICRWPGFFVRFSDVSKKGEVFQCLNMQVPGYLVFFFFSEMSLHLIFIGFNDINFSKSRLASHFQKILQSIYTKFKALNYFCKSDPFVLIITEKGRRIWTLNYPWHR